MLIREEEDTLPPRKGPFQHRLGVRRCADNAAVTPAEGFEISGGIHVRDGNDASQLAAIWPGDGIKYARALKRGPAFFNFGNICHIGHRTARCRIRQNHGLLGAAEDVGAFGHEVNAAEDNIIGFWVRGSKLRQLERVAASIGIFDDLVALIVMAQNQQSLAQLCARLGDAAVQFFRRHQGIFAWDRIGALCACMARAMQRGSATLALLGAPCSKNRQDAPFLTFSALSLQSHNATTSTLC